jgi:hypothetical protein
MLPKKGIVLPNAEGLGPYSRAIAYALKCELGSTHQATKIVMGWTGAGERTVKNWLAGISGPSGDHLVKLIRHSEYVLPVLLILGGRPRFAAVERLFGMRDKLAETIEQFDALIAENAAPDSVG